MWRLMLQVEKMLNIKNGLRAKIKFRVLPVKKWPQGQDQIKGRQFLRPQKI